jgi:DNA-binding NarL/FixJ family response regulator
MSNKIDVEKEIKIIELCEKGMSVNAIATELNTDQYSVFRVKKSLNL